MSNPPPGKTSRSPPARHRYFRRSEAHGALGILADLVGILGTLEADVVVDCGRLDPGSPSVGLFEGAKRPVLVTRPRLSDLHALAAWVESRPAPPATASLVVVGDGGYPDAEIEDALGIEVACRLPWDPRAAAALVSVAASDRQVRLAPLVRAARTLADRLAAEIAPVPGIAEAAEQPDEPPADRVPADGSKARVATRVLRAWRPTAAPASANGTGASEVSE
ncbi:MAG: hypothetical protein ACRDYY_14615 [Acidimicrobiales bacterium]